jgi:hypothetical protein
MHYGPHYALTGITEKSDTSMVTQGWIVDKPCRVTVDTGACVTVARPGIAAGGPERQRNPAFMVQTVWGNPIHLERNSAKSHHGAAPAVYVGFRRRYHR